MQKPSPTFGAGQRKKATITLQLDESLHILAYRDPQRVLPAGLSSAGRHLSFLLPELSCLTSRECTANLASLDLPRRGELPAEAGRLVNELRLSEQRFRLLFETHPLPLWIYDSERFDFLAVNEAAAFMFGYTRAELVAQRVPALWPPEQAAELEREVTRPRSAGFHRVGVRTRVKKDGSRLQAEIFTHDLVFRGRPARLVVANDVTRQQRTERLLTRSNRALGMLAANAPLRAVLEELCRGVEEEVGDGRCGVLLLDNGRVAVAAAPGLPEGMRQALHGRMPGPGEGTIGMAAFGPEPAIAGDIENDPRCAGLYPLLRPFGIRAVWSVPVRSASGGVAGALAVFLDRRRKPSREELEYGARAAQIAGIALDHHAADEAVRRLNAELEARVRQRTAELEEANRELESFGYTIAHDLRAPLRAIAGYTAMLLSDQAQQLDAGGRDHLGRIVGVSKRMAGMIDALLDLSRLSRLEIRRAEVNLSEIARAIAEELRSADAARQADFLIAPGAVVEADRSLMTVVLQNLLANAWKFTRRVQPARIEFGWGEDAGRRHFYVRDNGAGFDMSFAARLFEPFERLHRAADYEGSGIGLATVRRVIQRHGGRVWAESRPGEGASFFFSL